MHETLHVLLFAVVVLSLWVTDASDVCSANLATSLLKGWDDDATSHDDKSENGVITDAMVFTFRSCPLNSSYVDDIVNKFELCFSTNLTRPLQLLVQSNVVSQSCLLHALEGFRSSTGIEVSLQIYNASIAASQAMQELQVEDEWVDRATLFRVRSLLPCAGHASRPLHSSIEIQL